MEQQIFSLLRVEFLYFVSIVTLRDFIFGDINRYILRKRTLGCHTANCVDLTRSINLGR